MYLAGLHVPDDDVRELVRLVDEPTRSLLEKSLAFQTGVVALTIEDRERLLRVLDDVRTDALAELRGVLLAEHEWRSHDGPVSAPTCRSSGLRSFRRCSDSYVGWRGPAHGVFRLVFCLNRRLGRPAGEMGYPDRV